MLGQVFSEAETCRFSHLRTSTTCVIASRFHVSENERDNLQLSCCLQSQSDGRPSPPDRHVTSLTRTE